MDRFSQARRQFAVTEHSIYFDLANQNPTPRAVLDELVRYHSEAYRRGPDKQAYFDRVETVRGQVAMLLHCNKASVAFTKNTSEGLNIAATGIPWQPGDNVVLSHFEHPNNTYAWLALAKRGVDVRIVRPAGRIVTAADIIAMMDERTKAVTCSAVTYMPGERLDLAALSEACRRNRAYLVVDAVQALGIVDLDPVALGVDLLATSGHKGLLAPHGVGFLYCRREILSDIKPAFIARSSMRRAAAMEHDTREYAITLAEDARRFEYGNLNYSGISALGAGLDMVLCLGAAEIEKHVLELAGRLIDGLLALAAKGAAISVLTPREPERRAGIVGFTVPDVARVEAALKSARVVFTVRRDAVRFGLGLYNTAAEVDRVLQIIEGAVRREP